MLIYPLRPKLLVPSKVLQLRVATRGDLAFPRRFAVALTSITLAGVGGGAGVDELTEDLYIPVLIRFRLNKLGLGFPMPVVWHGFVFLGGVSSGQRCGRAEDGSDIYGSFPDFAGGERTSEEHELVGSGVLCLLLIWSSSPFASPSSSPTNSSGEDLGRYV